MDKSTQRMLLIGGGIVALLWFMKSRKTPAAVPVAAALLPAPKPCAISSDLCALKSILPAMQPYCQAGNIDYSSCGGA
ncbi:MAG: hypothetical protein ACRETA_14545 [Gammaproteobacteria bacterium]